MPSFSQHEELHPEHSEEHEVHVDAPTAPPEPQHHQQRTPVEESPIEQPAVVNVNVHQPPPPAAAPVPTPAPAPAPVADDSKELSEKLSTAYAEIERLRLLISTMPEPSTAPTFTSGTPTELRRRNRAISDDGSTLGPESDVGTYVEEGIMQPDGVPLQVVVVVMLGVFIVTYLFF